MSRLNEWTKKATQFTETALDKTQEIAKTAQLKLKLSQLESSMETVYAKIGRYYVSLIEQDQVLDSNVKEWLVEIEKINHDIVVIKQQLEELK